MTMSISAEEATRLADEYVERMVRRIGPGIERSARETAEGVVADARPLLLAFNKCYDPTVANGFHALGWTPEHIQKATTLPTDDHSRTQFLANAGLKPRVFFALEEAKVPWRQNGWTQEALTEGDEDELVAALNIIREDRRGSYARLIEVHSPARAAHIREAVAAGITRRSLIELGIPAPQLVALRDALPKACKTVDQTVETIARKGFTAEDLSYFGPRLLTAHSRYSITPELTALLRTSGVPKRAVRSLAPVVADTHGLRDDAAFLDWCGGAGSTVHGGGSRRGF